MADHLATQIKTARKTAGLSREQLAGALGVSLSTIVRYETGRTQRISVRTVSSIAVATDQPMAFFLGEAAA